MGCCVLHCMFLWMDEYLMLHCPLRVISTSVVDRDPSSSSYNASSGTFYSCVSQITIGKCIICQYKIAISGK